MSVESAGRATPLLTDPPPGGTPITEAQKPDEAPKHEEINLFSSTDLGTFEVYIKKNDQLNLHPMKISKILQDNSIAGIMSITKKGRTVWRSSSTLACVQIN